MDTDYEIGCGAQSGERELLREGRRQKSYGTSESELLEEGEKEGKKKTGRERAKVKNFCLEIASVRPSSLKANRNFA